MILAGGQQGANNVLETVAQSFQGKYTASNGAYGAIELVCTLALLAVVDVVQPTGQIDIAPHPASRKRGEKEGITQHCRLQHIFALRVVSTGAMIQAMGREANSATRDA